MPMIPYVNSCCGKCTVVFHGYLLAPSVKDQEHIRRLTKSTNAPNILAELEDILVKRVKKHF